MPRRDWLILALVAIMVTVFFLSPWSRYGQMKQLQDELRQTKSDMEAHKRAALRCEGALIGRRK
jgi:hypothetical protein